MSFFKRFLPSVAFLIISMGISGIASAANVVVFNDGAYVDNTAITGEATREIATLNSQGHTVTTFTGITAATINAATAGQDTLIIPEQQNASLGPALSGPAIAAIVAFVNGGGQFIVHGGASRDTVLLNTLFGFTTVSGANLSGAVLTGPTAVTGISNTESITTASLPVGTNAIYTDAGGLNTAVFDLNVGLGRVSYIGYDWFDALPTGAADSGWLNVLDTLIVARSASDVPTLSEWALILLVLMMGLVGMKFGRNNKGTVKSF